MKQECIPILLPSVELVNGMILLEGTKLRIAKSLSKDVFNSKTKGQHLYICSNLEIKLDDYIYDIKENIIHKVTRNFTCFNNHKKRFFKIIASTDSSLNLPKIPQKFIEQYVSSNGEIKEFFVEYEEFEQIIHSHMKDKYYELKLSPSNEIIISFEEEKKYSRSELKKTAFDSYQRGCYVTLRDYDAEQEVKDNLLINFDKWFDENY